MLVRTSRFILIVVGGVLLHTSYAAALNLEVKPTVRYQETVTARIVRPALDFGVIYGATTTMQGNTIVVTVKAITRLLIE